MSRSTKVMPMSNPSNYVARLEPFESREECNAASEAFFADLYALVNKHGIPDITFMWVAMVKDEEKPSGVAAYVSQGHMGDPETDEKMRFLLVEMALMSGEHDEAHKALAKDVAEAVEAAGVIAPCHFRWEFPYLQAALREARQGGVGGEGEEAETPTPVSHDCVQEDDGEP